MPDFGAPEVSYKGVFDKTIYDQQELNLAVKLREQYARKVNGDHIVPGAEGFSEERDYFDDKDYYYVMDGERRPTYLIIQDELKNTLKKRKKKQIERFFQKKIQEASSHFESSLKSDSGLSRETIKKTVARTLSASASFLLRKFSTGARGFFLLGGGEAAAEAIFGIDYRGQAHSEKLKELAIKVVKLAESKEELENGLDEELISDIEEAYILKRHFISRSLQESIDDLFIQYRNEEFDKRQRREMIQNALRMPQRHKKIDRAWALDRFRQHSHFESFDDSLKEHLTKLIVKVTTDSQSLVGPNRSLRSTCYLYGPPGSGKTSSAKELAKVLGLPCYEITISNTSDFTKENVEGCLGRMSGDRVGWLSDALMQKNEAEQRCYTNGFLILNDFDRVLFSRPDAIGFLLDLLDTDKTSYYSKYFHAEIGIERLNILVTANTALPGLSKEPGLGKEPRMEEGRLKNPFAALSSRVWIIAFQGFSEERLAGFVREFLTETARKYSIRLDQTQMEAIIREEIALQKQMSGRPEIELRNLKRQLEERMLFIHTSGGGVDVYRKKVRSMWQEKAEQQEDPEAYYQLGCLDHEKSQHLQGRVSLSTIQWYMKAAKRGHPEAQIQVGLLYQKGVPETQRPNMQKALGWIQKAAEKDYPEALYRLACYERDRTGVEEDEKEEGASQVAPDQAFVYLEKAAHKGHPQAQFELGVHHEQGGDLIEAIYWYQSASGRGHGQARNKLEAIQKRLEAR